MKLESKLLSQLRPRWMAKERLFHLLG